ncbi:FxSxx-COOH system tetratricopeptide repeat protein [Saccharopolyspora shandongensis]|uniref:FxSxx-COOH system tetratricopeptide repeat protein n=1 Tax=Saccharopolyspora shandongensis TaxID=418495 RepID=UPI0033F660C7
MNSFLAGPATNPGDSPLSTDDLTFREVRDALWLARRFGSGAVAGRENPDMPDDSSTTSAADASENPPGGGPSEQEPTTPQRREKWRTGAERFVQATAINLNSGESTAPLTWSATPALPQARHLARALRPFTRNYPSLWKKVLDEEATATRAAEGGSWLPEWRPAAGHRFDVALVVDTSRSMEVWRNSVRELRELLERLGAFGNVRTFLVDFSRPLLKQLALATEGSDTPRSWRELVDPTGRRLVLVATDAIGAAWRSGAAGRLLARWGRSMPVAVLQTMPQRLWHWSGLSPQRVQLSAPVPGAPNRQLRARFDEQTAWFEGEKWCRGTVVPVLALSPDWLADWARLVAQPGAGWIETTAVVAHPDIGGEVLDPPPRPAEEPTAHDQVLHFRTFASQEAFQLAGLLAAAPLSLPMMQVVQRVLLPNSDQSALAEVLLGGLLTRLPAVAEGNDLATPVFEFRDGVREELLATGRRSDTVRVARLTGDCGQHVPVLRNFRDAVDDPEHAEYPEATEETVPHLRVQEALFRALSGRHAARAKRVNQQLDRLMRASDEPTGRVEVQAPAMPLGSGSVPSSGPIIDQPPVKDLALTTTEPFPTADEAQFQPEGGDVTAPGFSHSIEPVQRGAQPSVWGAIPLRNPDFVGRDDLLEQLRSKLAEQGATAVLPEALHGMGGVGKTQTVVEYIYRHAHEYDVIWWVAAEHPTQIRSSFVELANKLGVPSADSADTAVPGVLEALRKGEPFSRWLLVFDNADRPEAVRTFFPAGSGHIIVTSRNSQWAGVARTVEVDLFTRAESEELLRRRDESIDDSEARELAAALGDLPLAIEQAAAWRAQTGMPVQEYLELLDENRTELLEAGTSGDYDLPVAAAWNVALSRLRSEHPAALELLQICAFFGPTPINREVFTRARAVPVPEALREALTDPIKLNRAIREISRYSLAKIDHRSNTLQLHRLVQTVLRNQVNEAEHPEMRHIVHLLLSGGDPGDPTNPETWSRYDDILPHVTVSRAMRCDDEWVRRLVVNLVRYLVNIGDYEGARDISGQAWETLIEKLGESHLDTLEMARQHGIALRRFGFLQQARDLNRKTYQLLATQVGKDSEHMLTMADVVATDLRMQGQFSRERDARREVYERAQRILGDDDPETLRYAHNYSSTLRLTGDFFGARQLDDDVWRRRSLLLGAEHTQTFGTLNALAIDVRECGHYAESCRLQEDALVRQRVLFGDNHMLTRGAARSLAVGKLRMGDYEAARELAAECYEHAHRQLGDLHEDSATTLMNLSTSNRLLGDLSSALDFGQHSTESMTQVHGAEHPFTLVALTNLAIVHRLRGAVDAARELNQRVLAAFRTAFTSDHPFVLVAATNLASDFAKLGEPATAHELDVETVQRSTRVLGAEHPATLTVALNLSLDLNQLGRTDEAAILHAKTVKALRSSLGAEHPVTVAATESQRLDCDTDTMQL